MPQLSTALIQLQHSTNSHPIYHYFKEALSECRDDHFYYTRLKQLIRTPQALGLINRKQMTQLATTLVRLIKLYWTNQAKASGLDQSFSDLLEALPSSHPSLKPHMARLIAKHPCLKRLSAQTLRDNHDNLLTLLRTKGHKLTQPTYADILRRLTHLYSKRSDLYTNHIHQAFTHAYLDAKVHYCHQAR